MIKIFIKNTLTQLKHWFSGCANKISITDLFLLCILALITIYPLFSGGFTTHDDVVAALNKFNGNTWEITKLWSISQGRFQFLWQIPLLAVPFIWDSQVWYFVIKFGSIFLMLYSLYCVVFKLFKSSWIALLSILFFWAMIQNGWEHNALTSFPFVFNLYITLFFTSIILFITAIDYKKLTFAIIAGILYFFSLGSELFILFFPLYIIVLILQRPSGENLIKWFKLNKDYILAIALPVVIYLTIYTVWRYIHPSGYDGNSFDGLNLIAASKVVLNYSLSALPLESLHFIFSPKEQLQFVDSVGWREILSDVNITSFIKSFIVGFLFVRFMNTVNFVAPKIKTLFFGIIVSGICIFVPNFLLGLTLRHQNWVANGTHSYIYTYYSFIFLVIFLALLFAYINVKSYLWNPRLRLAFISIIVIVMMFLSFVVDIRNRYIAFDQKLAQDKWDLMDVVIESSVFTDIPDESIIVAPTLLEYKHGIAAVFAEDWSNYIKYKIGKNVKFVNDGCNYAKLCYKLVFNQQQHSDGLFIVLYKINRSISLETNEIMIYSMPIKSDATIIGSFIQNKIVPKLEINGEPITNVGDGLFSSNFPNNSIDGSAQVVKITGNVDFVSERLTISNFNVKPQLQSLSKELYNEIDFTKKNYSDFLEKVSGISDHESWGRWTDANLGPMAEFSFMYPLPKKFILEIDAVAFGPNLGLPIKVIIGDIEKIFIIAKPNIYKIPFEINDGVHTIKIIPPKPTSPNEINPEDNDTRKLGIGLISLKIKN